MNHSIRFRQILLLLCMGIATLQPLAAKTDSTRLHICLAMLPIGFAQSIPTRGIDMGSAYGAYAELTGDSAYISLQFRVDAVQNSSDLRSGMMPGIGVRSYALHWGNFAFSAVGILHFGFRPKENTVPIPQSGYSTPSSSAIITDYPFSLGIVSEWGVQKHLRPLVEIDAFNLLHTLRKARDLTLFVRTGITLHW